MMLPAIAFSLLVLFHTVSFAGSGSSPLKAEVSAKSAILMNAETGKVLFEKNSRTPMYPASITKMITAQYALERLGNSYDGMITASSDAVSAVQPHVRRAENGKHPPYRLEFGGTHMGLKVGETLPFKTLLYGLMLVSANDAANVIAEHVSGSVSQFMQDMNEYVKSKGCHQTTLFTPHGLTHSQHKTTAYDMSLLAREALKNPLLCEVVKTVRSVRTASNMQPESFLLQHNALVKPGKFYYPQAMGIKTGYTSLGGYTLVAAAQDKKRKLVAVLLGCDNLEQRYKDAIALFDLAFHEKLASRTLFAKEFDTFSYKVPGGKTSLQAVLFDDLIVEYFPSEEPIYQSAVHWKHDALPIMPGQQVGEVRIFSEQSQLIVSSPLFASKEVRPTLSYTVHAQWCALKDLLALHIPLILALVGCGVVGLTFLIYELTGRDKKRKRSTN